MTKFFCDICGQEITPATRAAGSADATRLTSTICGKGANIKNRLTVEVTTGLNDTWNAGHFCKYCILEAVNAVDDRPTALVTLR